MMSWPAPEAYCLRGEKISQFAPCVEELRPAPEPEERTRLDPLERGSLFHEVAEHFLREQRDQGRLPLRDTPAELLRLRSPDGHPI